MGLKIDDLQRGIIFQMKPKKQPEELNQKQFWRRWAHTAVQKLYCASLIHRRNVSFISVRHEVCEYSARGREKEIQYCLFNMQ